MRINPKSLLFLALVSIPLLLNAEPPNRGKLPDGRAYRTDAEGMEIVDYIAELEVDNDTLKRRINSLEDELAIVKTRAASGSAGALTERDLIKNGSSSTVPAPRFAAESSSTVRGSAPSTSVVTCAAPISAAVQPSCGQEREKITQLQAQLTQTQEALSGKAEKLAASERSQRERTDGLAATVEKKNTEIARLNTDLVSLRGTQSAQAKQLSELEAALKERTSELGATKAKLVSIQAQNATADVTREAALAPQRGTASPRASFAASSSNSNLKGDAFDRIRSEITGEAMRLKNSIATRDSLFVQYSKSSRAVQFKPSSNKSSRGRDVSDLTQALQSANSFAELAQIKNELREIEMRVNDDIGLMKRMLK